MSTLAQNIIRDVYANLPAAGIEGRLFFVSSGTNAGKQYYDDGAAWQNVTPGGISVTTKGDIQGYASAPARVPVGSDGDVLTADSGDANGVSWQPGGGGGGAILGTAKFSGIGGVVSGLVVAGNISGVTRTGSGQYAVALTGSPTNYIVATAIGDTTSIVGVQIDPISSIGSSGFTLQVLTGGSVWDAVGVLFVTVIKL